MNADISNEKSAENNLVMFFSLFLITLFHFRTNNGWNKFNGQYIIYFNNFK